jgi:hypothetical protein
MLVIDKEGITHEVQKYIKSKDGEESVWCNDWYGRHVIGQDCEFSKEHIYKICELVGRRVQDANNYSDFVMKKIVDKNL